MTVIITMCHCGWKLIFLLNVSRPEPYTPMWSDTTQCCPIPMLGVTRTHELRNLIKNLQSGCYRLPWSGDLFLLVLQTTSWCVQIYIVEADWTFLPVHLDFINWEEMNTNYLQSNHPDYSVRWHLIWARNGSRLGTANQNLAAAEKIRMTAVTPPMVSVLQFTFEHLEFDINPLSRGCTCCWCMRRWWRWWTMDGLLTLLFWFE